MDTQLQEPQSQTFVETALKLSGKSEEEARTTGSLDRADDQVEALFAARYQTVNSPIHRAVWDHGIPVDLFTPVFAASRVAGWTAHIREQYADNRIIRPESEYIGPRGRTWVPIEERA